MKIKSVLTDKNVGALDSKLNNLKRFMYIGLSLITFFFEIIISADTLKAQVNRTMPQLWYGGSLAANFNSSIGTKQMLSSSFTTPVPTDIGGGVAPFGSLFLEYRFNKKFGTMLDLSYENRSGTVTNINFPSNMTNNTLKTSVSYLSIEPSFEVMPFSSEFYLFAGPGVTFNISKKFNYDEQQSLVMNNGLTNIRTPVYSVQIGAGFNFPVNQNKRKTWIEFSPFVAYQTNIGNDISQNLNTVRLGLAMKFGKSKSVKLPENVQ